MTEIYLIRHAEAEGNIYRRAHGQYNGFVTPKGYKQINLLGRRFENTHIDAVYSSDLTRAAVTATAISAPRGLPVVTTPELREVRMGAWEDRSWGDIEYFDNDLNMMFSNDPGKWIVDGAELYAEVGDRLCNCISSLAQDNDGKTIAVFSHGYAIRTFICRVLDVPSCETHTVPYCDNTAVTRLIFDSGIFKIEYAGDNSHLSNAESTLEQQSWWRAPERQRPENLRYLPLSGAVSEEILHAFTVKAGDCARADVSYAAYLVDEPVGIIGLDTHKGRDNNQGFINYIYVLPEYRNRSFGTQLLGVAVSDYRKLRRESLCIGLLSNSPGSPGLQFMLNRGFSVVPEASPVCRLEMNIRNW